MAGDLASVVKAQVSGIQRLVLGLSGGVDSMVLAQIVSGLPAVTMICAHVDHQVRPESATDAAFVRDWCSRRSLQCAVHRLEPCPKGANFEAWARRGRYQFFKQVCEQNNGEMIVTAHHAADVVETLLMRLCANREVRTIEASNPRARILRPLLSCTKAEIVQYALDHAVPYVEDVTNTDERFLRNRFRQTILPFLRDQLGSSIDALLFEQARNLDRDLGYLRETADELVDSLEPLPRYSREWLRQCRELLRAIPAVLQWRVAERLLIQDLGFRLGRRHSERFVIFVLGEQTGIQLPGGVTIRRRHSGLVLEQRGKENSG